MIFSPAFNPIFDPIFNISPILEMVIISLCGLVFGSFASALTYRVPRDIPWATSGKAKGQGNHGLRSACPACKTPLSAKDLLPILSWLCSRGKCRHCAKAVSFLYPLCECLTLAACLGIYAVYGITWLSIPFFLMTPFLVALMMIDWEHMILPNQLVTIIFALGSVVLAMKLMHAGFSEDIALTHLGGALLFGLFAWILSLIMKKILRKEALGMGDVKFFAVSGLWLGTAALGNFCIIAGAIGTILGLIWQKTTGKPAFPFGPALILSFYIVLLLQGSHFIEKGISY